MGEEQLQPELVSRNSQLLSSISARPGVHNDERVDTGLSAASDLAPQSLPTFQSVHNESRHPGPFQSRQREMRVSPAASSRTLSSLRDVGGLKRHDAGRDDSGVGRSSVGGYSMSLGGSRSMLGPPSRDTMQCLKCGTRFSVRDLERYERHIRDCYSS